MLKKISAMKARQNLGQVMNEVALKEDEYIVDYIISGDKHLTDLHFFRGIKIIDPAKF
jgi:hypothetical protein